MMPPEPFTQSRLCRTGNVCRPCQDPGEGGRSFRLSLLRTGLTGIPANGDAFACPHDQKPQPLTVKGILHGAAGLAKAAVGADRAPDDVIRARAAACDACAHGNGRVLCGVCSCVLAAKQRLASESCPLTPPVWGPVPRAGE